VKEAVTNLGVVSTRDVINFIHNRYPERLWKDVTIRCHLIGCSVNHSSSKHYPFPKFLFYIGNGKYRMHDTEKDGQWIIDGAGAHLADESSDQLEEQESLIEASITFERDLEEYILRNLNKIENGLRLYKESGITGQQLTIDIGRIDILALDKNNDFVVIELKSGIANYHVIGQILSYISWVRNNLAKGSRVRGIIIAEGFDQKLKYAVSELTDILLKKYNVMFEFEDIK
jgi:hypothetical protein